MGDAVEDVYINLADRMCLFELAEMTLVVAEDVRRCFRMRSEVRPGQMAGKPL